MYIYVQQTVQPPPPPPPPPRPVSLGSFVCIVSWMRLLLLQGGGGEKEEELDLMMGGMESVNRDRVFTDNPEVSGQESGRGSTSRFWVSSHALEGQKWKWFDQISCQWVPKESVCNDLFR